MKYDPQIPLENKYTQEETLTYNLTCWWTELREKIFPDYRHQKISSRKGDIRKSYLFKNVLKFVREKKDTFKGFQYVLYMRAQLEILKKIQNNGINVVVEANCLHGEQALKRWLLWKKKVALENNTTKITYKVIESNCCIELDKTRKSFEQILGDNKNIENYIKNKGNILKYVILKKISPLYIAVSSWFQKLDKEIKEDIEELSNVNQYKEYDLKEVFVEYKKYFEHEN